MLEVVGLVELREENLEDLEFQALIVEGRLRLEIVHLQLALTVGCRHTYRRTQEVEKTPEAEKVAVV